MGSSAVHERRCKPALSAFGSPPQIPLPAGRAAIGSDHCSADAACSALTAPLGLRPSSPTCRRRHCTAAACRDLIKQVRQCKTAAEERNVIAKESAALRQAFKEQDGTYRHRCASGRRAASVVVRSRAQRARGGGGFACASNTLTGSHPWSRPCVHARPGQECGQAHVHAHAGLPHALRPDGDAEAHRIQQLPRKGVLRRVHAAVWLSCAACWRHCDGLVTHLRYPSLPPLLACAHAVLPPLVLPCPALPCRSASATWAS